jgi:hypothetical protein
VLILSVIEDHQKENVILPLYQSARSDLMSSPQLNINVLNDDGEIEINITVVFTTTKA